MSTVDIHTLSSKWGPFELYSFFINGSEPALVDTGIASSPENGFLEGLEKLGCRVEDLKWILLTHGHIDHIGGAYKIWEMTGRKAKIVIHEKDVELLRSRRAHVEEYLEGRARYIKDPEGEAKVTQAGLGAISGEMEPDIIVRHGDEIALGSDVTIRVHDTPGHSAGSVSFEVVGQGDVMVGDAVQVYGAANGFPTYPDPDAYRSSLMHLRDVVKPNRIFMGHPFRSKGADPLGVVLTREQAAEKIQESLEVEALIRKAAEDIGLDGPEVAPTIYSPFTKMAEHLGYDGDPTREPSPFFTTMHGYFNKG
jgi:glyoxylase-like metal-dependent hydrolase (beta-lactamase superfamily II)